MFIISIWVELVLGKASETVRSRQIKPSFIAGLPKRSPRTTEQLKNEELAVRSSPIMAERVPVLLLCRSAI